MEIKNILEQYKDIAEDELKDAVKKTATVKVDETAFLLKASLTAQP